MKTPTRGLASMLVVAAIGALGPTPSIFAATDTTTFNVTATVLSACTVSATDLAFGNYDASSATPNDATSTVSAICTDGTSYSIALDAGLATGATVAARSMISGANTIDYALYTDSGRTTLWGDGTLSTSTASGTGDGSTQNHTVYGRISINQYVAPGSYSDTVTVTLTY